MSSGSYSRSSGCIKANPIADVPEACSQSWNQLCNRAMQCRVHNRRHHSEYLQANAARNAFVKACGHLCYAKLPSGQSCCSSHARSLMQGSQTCRHYACIDMVRGDKAAIEADVSTCRDSMMFWSRTSGGEAVSGSCLSCMLMRVAGPIVTASHRRGKHSRRCAPTCLVIARRAASAPCHHTRVCLTQGSHQCPGCCNPSLKGISEGSDVITAHQTSITHRNTSCSTHATHWLSYQHLRRERRHRNLQANSPAVQWHLVHLCFCTC